MTLIYAHRGYRASFSENTMTAFIEAERAGAEGIELDVQLTKDGIPVIIHDEKVDRTTGIPGYVKNFTYKEIRQLNADFKKTSAKGTEPIPSLEEVLEWLTTTPLDCNIEFKNGVIPYSGLEEKSISLVRKFGLEERVILSSFNHYSVVHCYRIAPDLETAPLFAELIYKPWVYAKALGSKGIHPNHLYVSDEIIKDALSNGFAVRPYTVNREKDMERLFEAGCTSIITDNPALALEIRNKKGKRH
ncbi:hypothetical protein A8F94_04020 [Bacillus sp. FJAT-27225]|uniref:glycerophosphodiester phosphodiesterase n=1 Tax=Bacillus sp. FJAT-27225 TaxID=1743144 RepID=UPI00080C326F|nr:glycerophosphodiester phosphodiesterase [Bacillus sp. FJAT-27225]OCA91551.1 hypothetical protein A8F94_04020 [Bacillus sp. FJAT-27225]